MALQESGTVNENTADTAEPIEISGGESAVNFDDLERLHDATAAKKDSKKEGGDDNGLQKESKEKEEVDQKASEPKEEEKPDAKGAEKKPVDKKLDKVKLLKVKNGETEIDLRPDSGLSVTVNGKPEQVTVQDLINNYSGKTDWTRKYSEFDRERKSFERDRSVLNQTVDTFYKLAAVDKDPMKAVEYLGEITGADMATFWDDFYAKITPKLEEEMALDPAERQLRREQQKNEYYKKQRETEARRRQEYAERQSLESKVRQLQDAHKIDDKTFVDLYEELSKEVKPEELTPELVAEYYVEVQSRKGLDKLVTELMPNMDPAGKEDAIDQLRKVMRDNPTFNEGDIREIATEVWGSKAQRNLSRKIAKSKPTNTAQASKERREDPVSFDELG